MALALVLRNAGRFNVGKSPILLNSVRLTPLKTYTTIVSTQRNALIKPLSLVRNTKAFQPIQRAFKLSAPRMAGDLNHSVLWTAERLLAVCLLGAIPLAFISPSRATEALLAVAVVLHTHWGVEGIVVDYVRPSIFGTLLPKIAVVSVFAISIAVLGGLFNFIYNDVGIVYGLKMIWALDEPKPEPELDPKQKKALAKQQAAEKAKKEAAEKAKKDADAKAAKEAEAKAAKK